MGNKNSTRQQRRTVDMKYGEDSIKSENKNKQSMDKLHKTSLDHASDIERNNRRKNSISYSSESDHEGFLDTQYLGLCHL